MISTPYFQFSPSCLKIFALAVLCLVQSHPDWSAIIIGCRAYAKILINSLDSLRKTVSNESIISQNNQCHHFLGVAKLPQNAHDRWISCWKQIKILRHRNQLYTIWLWSSIAHGKCAQIMSISFNNDAPIILY